MRHNVGNKVKKTRYKWIYSLMGDHLKCTQLVLLMQSFHEWKQ